MSEFMFAALALAVAGSGSTPQPPPDDLIRRLTDAIRAHCPNATIEVTKEGLIAKHDTMLYTVHRRSKGGMVSPETYQEEGPNADGFLLRVALHDGRYQGAAVVPQTLNAPYFLTYIDAPAASRPDTHYFVTFSYGSQLDPKLKAAIMRTIPQTRFVPGTNP